MIRCKINSILREHGKIICPEDNDYFKIGQTFIGISENITKKHSFFFQILEINHNNSHNGAILEIDSRKLGSLSDGDEVLLIQISVPIAEKITIGITTEENLGIAAGDWTSSYLPILKDKYFDLGDKINYAFETITSGKKINKIICGNLLESNIQSPLKIGDNTVIKLRKLPEKELSVIIKDIDKFKITRAEEYRQALKTNNLNLIGKLKSGQFKRISQSLDFKDTNGKKLNSIISGVFLGFEKFEEETYDESDSYSCTKQYIIRENNIPTEILEYQLISENNHGTLFLYIYSDSEDKSIITLNNIINQLEDIYKFMKKTEFSDKICPICGEKLDLSMINREECTLVCEMCGILLYITFINGNEHFVISEEKNG